MVTPEAEGPLLLFDGECGLCQILLRFLLARDARAVLRYAPLQGPTAQRHLRRLGLPTADWNSLVFLPSALGEKALLRTDGVVAVLLLLDPPWPFWGRCLRAVPRPMRDAGYKVVARLRYALFGEYRPRSLPREDWAERVLP